MYNQEKLEQMYADLGLLDELQRKQYLEWAQIRLTHDWNLTQPVFIVYTSSTGISEDTTEAYVELE